MMVDTIDRYAYMSFGSLFLFLYLFNSMIGMTKIVIPLPEILFVILFFVTSIVALIAALKTEWVYKNVLIILSGLVLFSIALRIVF